MQRMLITLLHTQTEVDNKDLPSWRKGSLRQQGQVHLLIRPSDNAPISKAASILQKLTTNLPSRQFNIDNWTTVEELQLADPGFNDPQKIDMIIGAAHYEDLMIGKNRIKEQTGSI